MSFEFRRQGSRMFTIILVVTIVALALHKPNRASTPSTVGSGLEKKITEVSPGKNTKETPAAAEQPKLLPQYSEIKSESDRRRWIVDQLRALGAPNEVLARVARADFEVQWDSRFEECGEDQDKLAAVQLDMNTSKDAEMRAALGEEDFKQWDQGYMLWEAMSTKIEVTAAEAEALYDLKKKLQQRVLELDKATLKGTMDGAEINDAVNQAYSEFNLKMKSLLGDERYAKSQQLDDAFVADYFRSELASAKPSDPQFQELFEMEKESRKARTELDRQFENDTSSPDYLAKIKALAETRDQEFQRVLGAEAFNDLRKQQDSTYTAMKKFQNLWGLDDKKVDYVYDTMKGYQKSVEEYQGQVLALANGGLGVNPDEVNQRLQQLAEQTQQALQNNLGQDSFNKLQRNRVLRWAVLGSRMDQNGSGPSQ